LWLEVAVDDLVLVCKKLHGASNTGAIYLALCASQTHSGSADAKLFPPPQGEAVVQRIGHLLQYQPSRLIQKPVDTAVETNDVLWRDISKGSY
jgi:hypothetical protein